VSFSLSSGTLLLGLAIWLAATIVTLAVAALIVVRLPPTYFVEDDAQHAARSRRGARFAPWLKTSSG
jgi:hypothetical protein